MCFCEDKGGEGSHRWAELQSYKGRWWGCGHFWILRLKTLKYLKRCPDANTWNLWSLVAGNNKGRGLVEVKGFTFSLDVPFLQITDSLPDRTGAIMMQR